MRKLRTAHDPQTWALRAVSRVHGLPRVQNDKEAGSLRLRPTLGSGCTVRGEVSPVRQTSGDQERPFWRIHRLQRLSGVQVRQKENNWNLLPQAELQGRAGREKVAPRQG